MTAYPRLTEDDGTTPVLRDWEDILPVRQWLYQTPEQILIKASNGASDFGNKFGQPLITGSLLTFEHQENGEKYAYDKVIMLAGGVGYGTKRDCLKGEPQLVTRSLSLVAITTVSDLVVVQYHQLILVVTQMVLS